MPDRIMYTLDVPSDTVFQSQSQVRRNLATFGAVGSGQSTVENISLDPNQQLLSGRFAGKYAELSAAEVEELFDAPDYGAVPIFGASTATPQDAYYSLENVDAGAPAPAGTTRFQRFDGALRKEGTTASHWRATTTRPTSVNNVFGNQTTAYLGVPAAATKLRWLNPETEARATPTIVATRSAEYGDVDIIDAEAAPWSIEEQGPAAIYSLDYQDDPDVDVAVWDTRGEGLANKFDADGHRLWGRVFRPSHRFENQHLAIVDNGLLRLIFDESNQTLQAQQWDDANTTWSSLALGTSDWQLFDVDLRRIGMARVEARVEFEDPTTSPNSYYTLQMVLPRGYIDALWFRTPEQNAVPSGLGTLLDPVANEQVISAEPTKGLVPRSDVQP